MEARRGERRGSAGASVEIAATEAERDAGAVALQRGAPPKKELIEATSSSLKEASGAADCARRKGLDSRDLNE